MLTNLLLAALLMFGQVPGEADAVRAPEVPPLPRPSIMDSEQAAQYAEALQSLEKGAYTEARNLFRKLKSQVKEAAVVEAVERCLHEAEGGLELEKANEYATKNLRRAYFQLGKVMERYQGTLIGVEIDARFQKLHDEIFFTVADFESDASGDQAGKDDAGGGEGERPGRGDEGGYGANTRVVEGTPEDKKVRTGKAALSWLTGKNLSTVNFTAVEGKVADYRFLNISLRTDDPKERPNLVLLFDCLEWQGDGEGPGGGPGMGRGRGGAAWVYQRDGFSQAVTPDGEWEDLRLDLQKFTAKGSASWGQVVALRIIHMPGVSATIRIDNVRLEKE